MALVAAPLVLMHACGDDEPAPATGGTAGTAGSGGSGGSGGASGGSAGTNAGGGGAGGTKAGGGGTAGSGGSTGGGGGTTEGGAGSSTEGGAGTVNVDAGDAKVDVALPDVVGDGGNPSKTCTDPSAYMDSGLGLSCNDYCKTFMDVCNSDPILGDSGAFYTNMGDCLQKCGAFSQAQLCCYAVHVNNAERFDGGTRSTHCTHAAGAAGQNVCPAHP
jgi:hypothetical protein